MRKLCSQSGRSQSMLPNALTRIPVCRAKLGDEFRPAKLCAKQGETPAK